MGTVTESNRSLPHKGAFLLLFTAWCALFHIVGNSSFGYVNSPSLFGWLNGWYHLKSVVESGDELCPLVPFISLGLLWFHRHALLAAPKKIWLPGLLLVAAGIALHCAAFLVQQVRISGFAFLLGSAGLMATLWGTAFLRLIAFPWFLMVFAIPLDAYTNGATFPLRMLSTTLSVGFCKAILGLQITQEGVKVYRAATETSPGFAFEVVAACSGIRSASVILLISLIHSHLYVRGRFAKLAVILSSVPLAVLGNVVRLIFVFVVGSIWGEVAAKRIETNFGFITYACAVIGVMLLGRFLQRYTSQPPEAHPAPSDSIPAPPARASLIPAALALALVASGWILLLRAKGRQHLGTPGVQVTRVPTLSSDGRIVRSQSARLPQLVKEYAAFPAPIDDTEWSTLPPDTIFGRMIYQRRAPHFEAKASVILMGADRTSIHQPEFCLTGNGWDIRSRSTRQIPFDRIQGGSLDVRRFDSLIQDSRGNRKASVYVFWFVADGQWTASHWTRTLWMTRDLLTRNVLQRWAYISYFAVCDPGQEDATFDQLCDLIRATVPEFQISGIRSQ